jgi:ketosteroid isomerase-like protein
MKLTSNEEQLRGLIDRWAMAVCDEDLDGIQANHDPDILMFDLGLERVSQDK